MTPKESDNSVLQRGDYFKVSYDPAKLSFTSYPLQLVQHLSENLLHGRGRLIDIGCSRGEFLTAFSQLGYTVAGVDISPAAPDFAPEHDVRVADLEKDPLPFDAAGLWGKAQGVGHEKDLRHHSRPRWV